MEHTGMNCLYLKCLEYITGYADIGNELNYMSAEDEYKFKSCCLPIMLVLVRKDIAKQKADTGTLDLTSCVSRYANLDSPSDKIKAEKISLSENSLSKRIKECVIHKGVTIDDIYEGIKDTKVFRSLMDAILNMEIK